MAPFAILHHFDTFRCIFLVLVCTIIAALAFCACKSNSFTHYLHLTQTSGPRPINMLNQYIISNLCKSIFFTLKKAGPSQRDYNTTAGTKMQILFHFFEEFRSLHCGNLLRFLYTVYLYKRIKGTAGRLSVPLSYPSAVPCHVPADLPGRAVQYSRISRQHRL